LNPITRDALITISKGNPGALTVLIKLVEEYGEEAVGLVGQIDGLTGSEIWLLFKDVNKQDIHATYQNIISGPDAVEAALRVNRDSRFYNAG
jgi:hypothetical protein